MRDIPDLPHVRRAEVSEKKRGGIRCVHVGDVEQEVNGSVRQGNRVQLRLILKPFSPALLF